MRGIERLYALEKDLRAAAPVVELLATRRQRGDIGAPEALLQEPVRRVRGQREELAQLERFRTLLAGEEQALAVARVAVFRRYGQAGELGAFLARKRVQRRAAADRAVVLHHQEVADLGLEQLAAALHERAVGLEWLDQRQHAAYVLDLRRAQPLQRVCGDHGADAGVGEE